MEPVVLSVRVVTARTAPALVTAAGCMFVLNMLARLNDQRCNPGNVNCLDTSQGLITSGCVDGRLMIKHRTHYAFDSYVDLLVENIYIYINNIIIKLLDLD